MFYLEDLAYEVRTPKFIKVRNAVTVIIILCFMIQAAGIYMTKVSQENTVQSNLLEIADCQLKCSSIKSDIEKFEDGGTKTLYNSWEPGIAVADLQGAYGGIPASASVEYVAEAARNTASSLDRYISDPFGRTPWYNNAACQYTWTYLNRQTSVVEKVPSIWICRSDNSNVILAVTTGVYDGLGELFGDFTVYYTTKGNALLDDDVRLVNGNIISSVDFIDYYKNIDDVINGVAENLSETEDEPGGRPENEPVMENESQEAPDADDSEKNNYGDEEI